MIDYNKLNYTWSAIYNNTEFDNKLQMYAIALHHANRSLENVSGKYFNDLDIKNVEFSITESETGIKVVVTVPYHTESLEGRLTDFLARSSKEDLITIAKSWSGHDGVNWETTHKIDIELLIKDAILG